MHPKLEPYEKLVEEGYLRKAETDKLVLYTYTDQCTYEKHWNDYTRQARGLILEKESGKVIAKPFPKFFNLGEMEETYLTNLPNEKYDVFEKIDGSLGIIYFYNDKWNVATKGSFNSEQAIKAQELLNKYNMEFVNKNLTVLVEIIYPENKIVVDYGKEEKLILISVFDSEKELDLQQQIHLSSLMQMERAQMYNYTIEEMIRLQKTIPKDQEGFVVRFSNGLRVKIKGEEYLKIHKILSRLSPIDFWEAMKDGTVNKDYLIQIPEEFKQEFEPIVNTLESKYQIVKSQILNVIKELPVQDINTPEKRKTLGLFLKQYNLQHSQAIFPYFLNKEALDNYIMKYIRPKANNL